MLNLADDVNSPLLASKHAIKYAGKGLDATCEGRTGPGAH